VAVVETQSDATANGNGTVATVSGPCTVEIEGASVLDGAEVAVQTSYSNVSGDYITIGVLKEGLSKFNVQQQGTYYVRTPLTKAGSSSSVTIKVGQ